MEKVGYATTTTTILIYNPYFQFLKYLGVFPLEIELFKTNFSCTLKVSYCKTGILRCWQLFSRILLMTCTAFQFFQISRLMIIISSSSKMKYLKCIPSLIWALLNLQALATINRFSSENKHRVATFMENLHSFENDIFYRKFGMIS